LINSSFLKPLKIEVNPSSRDISFNRNTKHKAECDKQPHLGVNHW
jgi:hypothetical protein